MKVILTTLQLLKSLQIIEANKIQRIFNLDPV